MDYTEIAIAIAGIIGLIIIIFILYRVYENLKGTKGRRAKKKGSKSGSEVFFPQSTPEDPTIRRESTERRTQEDSDE